MASTTTVAARLDPELREQASAILQKAHITDTDLIRKVYEYVVYMGDVPEFVKTGEYSVRIPRSPKTKYERLADTIETSQLKSYDLTGLTDQEVLDTLAKRGDVA